MTDNGKSHAQLLVEERTGREIGELLRDLYVARRHSQQEIANALSTAARTTVSRSTVKSWLEDLGITRDDRPAVAL